jgi:hypothetical protein
VVLICGHGIFALLSQTPMYVAACAEMPPTVSVTIDHWRCVDPAGGDCRSTGIRACVGNFPGFGRSSFVGGVPGFNRTQ